MGAKGLEDRSGAAGCECGRQIGADDRFCASCGRAVGGGPAPVEDPAHPLGSGRQQAGAEVSLLLGGDRWPRRRAGGPGRSEVPGPGLSAPRPDGGSLRSEVRTGFPAGTGLAVGAGVVILLLSWSLFRGPGDEVAPVPADEPVAETAPEPSTSTTTTAPGSGRGEGGDGTATTDPDAAVGDPAPEGPLLGEPTGLVLAIGGLGSNSVQLLDLDTGRLRELEGLRGTPSGMLGSNLVMTAARRLALVDLGVAEPEPLWIEESSGATGWGNFVGVADGLAWVISQDPDDPASTLLTGYDADGVVREATAIDGQWFGSWSIEARDLVQHPAGGIYRRSGDGHRRLSTGRLLAAADGLALIDECDDALVCRTRWMDIATWTDAGHPDPPPPPSAGSSAIVASGRLLVVIEWQGPREMASVYKVATGDLLREMSSIDAFGPLGVAVPISDDGRWLLDIAFSDERGVALVVDLHSGREWPIPFDQRPDQVALFLDADLVAPAP